MFVKSAMIRKEKCYTVKPGDSVQVGLDLLEKFSVDALPVVEGNKFKGIFTWYHAYQSFFNTEKFAIFHYSNYWKIT